MSDTILGNLSNLKLATVEMERKLDELEQPVFKQKNQIDDLKAEVQLFGSPIPRWWEENAKEEIRDEQGY